MTNSVLNDDSNGLAPFRAWGRIKQAAVYAGVKERTISEWLDDGLRCARCNRKTVLIRYTDIDAYLLKFIDNEADIDVLFDDLA